MTNCHGNGKLPIAIRHEGKILYFESQKDAAYFCRISTPVLTERIKKKSLAPIKGEYYIDFEETKKIRDIAGVYDAKIETVKVVHVRDENGFTWNVKLDELKDPKLLIAKYCSKLSTKQLAELTELSTKEVRRLFEECWKDPAYEKYVRG